MTKEPDSFARDQWYAVTSSLELSAAKSRATELMDRPIRAIWDREGGITVTLLGPDGSVERKLPAQERYGYVWTTLGDPEKPLFEMPEFDEEGRRLVICGGITLKASGPRIIENFLDMAHFPYVHEGILGSEEATEVLKYKVEHRKDCDELWATECGFRQPQAMAASEGASDVDYLYRVAQPFSSVLYKSSPSKAGAFDLIGILVQPRGETLSDVHCFMLVYDETSTDDYLVQWQQSIFLQDRIILENQRPLRLPLARTAELPIPADVMSVLYRKWLREKGLIYGVEPA